MEIITQIGLASIGLSKQLRTCKALRTAKVRQGQRVTL